ncbi:MAG: hypothetical protein ABSF52_10785 [Syntrophobacteraceae bacterium]|jgi:hypothetical protein
MDVTHKTIWQVAAVLLQPSSFTSAWANTLLEYRIPVHRLIPKAAPATRQPAAATP